MGDFVSKSEKWLHDPETAEILDKALDWADAHEHTETDLEELEKRLLNDVHRDHN